MRSRPMRHGASFATALSLTALLLASCQVDPYCFDCVDERLDSGRADSGDTGVHDSGRETGTGDADVDANVADAYVMPDGCAFGATELCNHFDDDCDLLIDEGVNTTTDIDNCGSCGHRCIYAHAFGECNASTCSQGACQAGYVDVDGMDS